MNGQDRDHRRSSGASQPTLTEQGLNMHRWSPGTIASLSPPPPGSIKHVHTYLRDVHIGDLQANCHCPEITMYMTWLSNVAMKAGGPEAGATDFTQIDDRSLTAPPPLLRGTATPK